MKERPTPNWQWESESFYVLVLLGHYPVTDLDPEFESEKNHPLYLRQGSLEPLLHIRSSSRSLL